MAEINDYQVHASDPSGLDSKATKLDVIRDILFGQHVKEQEQQYEQLEKHILANHQKVENQINTVQQQVLTKLEQIEASMLNQVNQVEEAAKAELTRLDNAHVQRQQLGEMLIKLGNQLSA